MSAVEVGLLANNVEQLLLFFSKCPEKLKAGLPWPKQSFDWREQQQKGTGTFGVDSMR